MISKGMILYFAPRKFASGVENKKLQKRLMLVIDISNDKKTFTLLNIFKVSNKPAALTYKSNVLVNDYKKLFPEPSFVKLNDNYIIEYFKEVEKCIYKKGNKISKKDFKNISKRYFEYLKGNKLEVAFLNKEDLIKDNKI